MKIESLRIQNFRGFSDQHIVVDDYTCIVGPNGAGKSTVLAALNVFFRQYKDSRTDLSRLSVDDFHHKNVDSPIRITVTFTDISEAAADDLSDYVRQGKLVVSSVAEYNPESGRAEVRQFGNRLGMEEFRRYFEAEKRGAQAKELQQIFGEIKEDFPALAVARTKEQMANALLEFEANNPGNCTLIPSEDQFYGVSRGANRLAPHIQWIFVPAAKDITVEAQETKDTALGQLLARTIRSKVDFAGQLRELREEVLEKYEALIGEQQGVLDEFSLSIQMKLRQWSHPDATARVLWTKDAEKSVKVDEPWATVLVGERGFESNLARFGHGLQRSYMLTLLQELSEGDEDLGPTLIMGIEEPEIYQHPPQIRYLSDLLQEMSSRGSQILVCTHSPSFVPGERFDSVRMIKDSGDPPCSVVSSVSYDALRVRIGAYLNAERERAVVAKLYPALNSVTSEMFFCKYLVLVEGLEDVAYLSAALELSGLLSEFRRLGGHIVAAGRKSDIPRPLAIAKELHIPVFVLADADTDTNPNKEEWIRQHRRDNRCILDLMGYQDLSEWPENDLVRDDLLMWRSNITDRMSGEAGWDVRLAEARTYYGDAGGLTKNPLAIANALERMWRDGNEVVFLRELCEAILLHARGNQ